MTARRPTADEEFVFDGPADAIDPAGATDTGDAADPEDATGESAASGAPSADTPAATSPAAGTAVTASAPAPAKRRSVLLLALVAVLTLTMIALGVVFLVGAASRGDDDNDNRAVVDQAATTQVIGEVSQALNQIFTYDYRTPQASQQAAASVLVGDASSQYTTLFQALQQKAPDQQLTLTAKTVNAAVSSLTGDTAQLLVFLDQSSTRASDSETSYSAAQLRITAVQVNGSWKISELQPL